MVEAFTFWQTLANYMGIICIPLMTLILGRKLLKERKEKGAFNIPRTLMFAIFVAFSWILICEFVAEISSLASSELIAIIGVDSEHFSLYMGGIGVMITCALTLFAYSNQVKSLYYAFFFFYGGMIAFYFATSNDVLLIPYIYIGGVVGLIFLYYTAFKLKDNGSLGLSIVFTFSILALAFSDDFMSQFLTMAFSSFGLFFALGYFTPFKEVKEVTEYE